MRIIYPFFLFCCLIACQNHPAEPAVVTPVLPPLSERLARSWLLSDFKVQGRVAPDPLAEVQKEKLLEAGVIFHFFPDGQWVFIEGNQYHKGQWTLDEANHKIRCTYPAGDSAQTVLFKIRRLQSDSLLADLTRGTQILSATLESDRRMYDSPEKCPWHPVNNSWRAKPDHAETDAEIKQRATNHLRHYYTLLDAAINNQPHIVSIRNSPSCIQIYSSGIGLREPERIDAAWYATFFNRRDADKCLQLYRKMLPADGVLVGPKTRSWMNDDMTLLQRMMNRLQDL